MILIWKEIGEGLLPVSQKLGSSLLKQASDISSLRWVPGAAFRNPWKPDPPCLSGFLPHNLVMGRISYVDSWHKSSPTFVIFYLSDNSCSNRCEVVPHSGFDLHFPDDQWCWVSFHVPVGHLYVFYGKVPIQILCPFLNWFFWGSGVWVEWVLYVFWILTPDQIYVFANIFSFSVGCHFILLMISFTVQKLFDVVLLV